MQRVYFYQDTVIAVRPGLGGDNWATCRRKANGAWTTVKSKEMPRVKDRKEAEINFRVWAESKHLNRADCGSCSFCHVGDGVCKHYEEALISIQVIPDEEPTYIKLNVCGR